MSNKMLNNILIIKVNAPKLAKVHGDIEREIVKRAVPKYFIAKKWRRTIKQKTTDVLKISSTQADDKDLIEEEDIWESDDDEELDRIVNPKLHDEDDNDVELKETEKIVSSLIKTLHTFVLFCFNKELSFEEIDIGIG